MKDLKGTKTEKNLQEAFAGESQARNKYTYFASKARKEGYEQIAAIFEETAANEKEHAKLWFKYLEGGDIKDTKSNLEAAAAGENFEWTDMYARMAEEAKEEGFVLDHIKAGMSLQIYRDLKLDKLDCTVAIIKNAKSSKMGKKDIIKVECPIESLDLDILGFIDHNITVNVIKGDKIVDKMELKLPHQVKNVIKCKNPRCITSIEQELDQIFVLSDEKNEIYRCKYCEEKYEGVK